MLNSILLKKLLSVLTLFCIFWLNVFAAEDELYVERAYSVWANEVAIVFSNEISDISLNPEEALFRIDSVKYPEDIYSVSSIEIDEEEKNIVFLTIDKNFIIWEEYTIVVLKIQDIYWQNIKYWIDSEAVFYYSWETSSNDEINTNNITEIENTIPEDVGQSSNTNVSPSDVPTSTTTTVDPVTDYNEEVNLWWIQLNAWDVENQVDSLAKDNTKLPTTWPEHIILLIWALIIGCFLFIYRYKNI